MSGQYDFGVVISPSPVNKVYRKKYLEKNSISFLNDVYYEDVLFAFQTLLANGKIVTIPNTQYHPYSYLPENVVHREINFLSYSHSL